VNTLFFAFLSIALSVMGQFSLKTGMSSVEVKHVLTRPFGLDTAITVFTDKFVLGGLSLYGLGAIVWLGVLSKWDVSKAYPLVGLGFGLTVIVGALAGEQVSPIRAAGVALICVGVVMVGRS
jgi:multidrug transporter EmrE-like cation transporter